MIDSPFPIFRMEFSGMKQSIMTAITDHQLQINESFRLAVEEACDPKRIQAVMNQAVQETLDEAIKSEIKSYFSYGDGRKLVEKAVIKKLKERNKL